MRRRLPWIIFFASTLAVAGVSQLLADYPWPPEEDGSTAIPMLRMPVPEQPKLGPVPVAPLVLSEITWRVSFRWLGQAPSNAALEAAVREAASAELPGFTVQPRPAPSLMRKLRRAPLVPAPGLEFAHAVMPVTPDLSPYETASSDPVSELASGESGRGEQNVHLAHQMLLIDFHLTGADILAQLQKVDAFVVAFAERTHARIKSDERRRQATVEEFRGRRLKSWSGGIPFAPSYVNLAEADRGGRGRVLLIEEGRALALPELWLSIPNGVIGPRARNLLIAGVAQRLVENRLPDAEGVIELDVRALKHPDMEGWITSALPPGATGKLRLTAREVPARGGRLVLLAPEGEPVRALCAFAGCELSASFGE